MTIQWNAILAKQRLNSCNNKKKAKAVLNSIRDFYIETKDKLRNNMKDSKIAQLMRDAEDSRYEANIFKSSKYKYLPESANPDDVRVSIFEAEYSGSISLHERDELLEILESKISENEKYLIGDNYENMD